MIPLKLQIKNFLSYGPELQEVDFTRYQMICLSGKNGHGKSALLDAITWAVWGQARKTSGQPKPDHGLLHLGERNMKVIFDFEFNNRHYRVRREFTFAYGKPSAYLEFGMFTDDSDELITLTDKTIRKTQAKIELLLGLDFDSFVNSAFIRQGNAGEFSNKSPKERKEILGNILGLATYDKLRKLASEKARLLENERQVLLKIHERLSQDLDQQAKIEAEYNCLQISLNSLQVQQDGCENKINEIQKLKQNLIIKRQFCDENNKKLLNLNNTYQQGVTKLFTLRATWKQIIAKIAGTLDRQELEKQQDNLFSELAELRFKQQESWRIREALAQSQGLYQKIVTELVAAHTQKINSAKLDLEKLQLSFEHQRLAHNNCLQELDHLLQNQEIITKKLQEYGQIQVDHHTLQAKFDRYKDFYQRLIVMGNAAKYEQDELVRKQIYLEQDCPTCPLCEQNLSLTHKQFLAQQFLSQLSFAKHRIKRVAAILKNLKSDIYDQHAQLEKERVKLQEISVLQVQLEQINNKIAVLQLSVPKDAQNIASINLLIQDQTQSLILLTNDQDKLILDNLQAQELKILITNYERELLNNNYSEEQILTVQNLLDQVTKLLTFDVGNNLMNQKNQILAQISSLVQELKTQKILIKDLNTDISHVNNLERELENLEKSLLNLSQEYNSYKDKRDLVLQTFGSVQEQLKKIAKTKIELDQLKKDLINLENAAQDYKSLVGVFGKDGIQALLIEDAIPEIEQEANYLLGRLTDNQAQLFIESLRDLKSGGTKETLDIKISDSAGLRPYEMFSGGEAFRIDFALRIAISKLLARRAGTALQTLIIDEGFGSQDEEGLAHIMDALYKIQDDFAKIIIVSHLNTMKEQFPVHFFIQKNATGSTVTVMEQG